MTKNLTRSLPLLLLGSCLSTYSVAQEEVPPPEVLYEEGEQKHLPEPEVTIIRRKGATIEEFRVNGRLRYAKITPSSGPPYYMVDTDGDGELDTKHDFKNAPIQQWILMRW